MVKKGQDIRLVLGAIPVFNLNKSEGCDANDGVGQVNDANLMSPMGHVDDVNECQNQQQCYECTMKDLMIKQYESKIESLQIKVDKLQRSTNYFKSSKSKLKQAFNEEKETNRVDPELIKELEVGFK